MKTDAVNIQRKFLNPIDRDGIELSISRGDLIQPRLVQMLLNVIDDLTLEISAIDTTPDEDCVGCLSVEEYQAIIASLRSKLQDYDLWLGNAPKSYP